MKEKKKKRRKLNKKKEKKHNLKKVRQQERETQNKGRKPDCAWDPQGFNNTNIGNSRACALYHFR